MLEEDLERSEERLNTATTKLAEASHSADESERYKLMIQSAMTLILVSIGFHDREKSVRERRTLSSGVFYTVFVSIYIPTYMTIESDRMLCVVVDGKGGRRGH